MGTLFSTHEFTKLKDLLVLYRCALKNMEMRVDTILEDFENLQNNNPLEHVKFRLKTPESIAEKLERRGFELTAESARGNLFDVAGVRCICSYARDIPLIVDVFKRQPDITILEEKDYITNPKPSGYRSYHLIVKVPIHLTNETEYLPVEIQIRTQAMDFWAALEHKVRYKYNNKMPEHLHKELIDCASEISQLDERMYKVQEVLDLAY